MTEIVSRLRCPLCQTALVLDDRVFCCDNAHRFDQAKEGYVNLHLAQHKRSAQPGDNRQMVRGRQRFLNAGYYQGLADFLQQQLQAILNRQGGAHLLDGGCGEGYYLEALNRVNPANCISGIDISKEAVRLAAKRRVAANLAVASCFDLPFADRSVDVYLSVFSPYSCEQLQRVLAVGAQVVLVGPAAEHLRTLVEKIYQKPIDHQGNQQQIAADSGFKCVEQTSVMFEIEVVQEHVMDLLMMTPYYWQASAEQQSAIAQLDSLKTTAAFDVSVWELTT